MYPLSSVDNWVVSIESGLKLHWDWLAFHWDWPALTGCERKLGTNFEFEIGFDFEACSVGILT
jgi:hypothetical protein